MADILNSSAGVLIIALLFGYALGSIPFGLIFTRLAGLGDVRSIGSGNIGATNVLRTGNKKLAAATLLSDMAKGLIAVIIAKQFGLEAGILAGIGAFLGHCFPIWLKFKGGKGVATFVGVMAGLLWQAALVFIAVWLLTWALTRYSSLAALVATLSASISSFWLGNTQIFGTLVLLTILTWLFHRENISRLLSGRESKIGAKE
ncbi:MAG: glycerol-3-phosphate acyltransferase [Hyphomicrobiales bacterium]|nr:glycerol-3-phosphate 1-O-acyltransferase PlsY [Hyphomicrobiales bacterium]PCH49653.1 MAG: glycerol-3-phosphate acyltransferase [Hyphomicrobiales bacterium]